MAGFLFKAGGQTEQARRCRSLKINHHRADIFGWAQLKAGSIYSTIALRDYYAKGRQEQAATGAV
jgi:hypothetical protein